MRILIICFSILCLSTLSTAQTLSTAGQKGALRYSTSVTIPNEKSITVDYWSLNFGPVTFDYILEGNSRTNWYVCELSTDSDVTFGGKELRAGKYTLSIQSAGADKIQLHVSQDKEKHFSIPLPIADDDSTHDRLAINFEQPATGNAMHLILYYGKIKSIIRITY